MNTLVNGKPGETRMKMEKDIERHARFKSPVIAALETCADLRLRGGCENNGGANANADDLDEIDRTVAIIQAASARIEANDYSAVEAVCVSQALALDVIFEQFARHSARGEILFHDAMRMALRAQSQCRATLRTMISLKNPKAVRFSSKQTVENAKIST